MSQSPEPIPDNLKQLIIEGKKIEAIKAYRSTNNCDLKDAKDKIDTYERELRNDPTYAHAFTSRKSGCMGLIILLLALPAATGLVIYFV